MNNNRTTQTWKILCGIFLWLLLQSNALVAFRPHCQHARQNLSPLLHCCGRRHRPFLMTHLHSSYLDSLSPRYSSSHQQQQQQQVHAVASFFSSSQPPSSAPPPTTTTPCTSSFFHATASYFALDKLVSKGPRATKDWGTPQDSTRLLVDDDFGFCVGSWSCTPGGWPSPNHKAHTEVFLVLQGHGCLTDEQDGKKHYFGPGDHVIIPKGHTGRWDVFTELHKIWAVNDHNKIEETAPVIRVQVDHYHSSFASHNMVQGYDALYGSTSSSVASKVFYQVGPTTVGSWTAPATTSFPVETQNKKRIFAHILQGVLFVTNAETGEARRCVAGDTFMLPRGFVGHVDVVQGPVHKLWTTAD